MYALYIANGALFHPAAPSPFPARIVANFQTIRAKRGKNKLFFGGGWCFLGNLGDKKGQKLRYILISWLLGCCFHPLLWWRWSCPLGAGGQAFGVGPSFRGVFRPFLPAFCPLASLASDALA